MTNEQVLKYQKLVLKFSNMLCGDPFDWFELKELIDLTAMTTEFNQAVPSYMFNASPLIVADPGQPWGTISFTTSCDHNWKQYQGLNQVDTYCTKCNKVKG
jgi:hypothetical protein